MTMWVRPGNCSKTGIYEDTIFIFTTDNGTAFGQDIYNAGMGYAGSEYDGGHRVPFFMHWPRAGMNQLRKINTLCHAVDIAPTLLDLIGASGPKGYQFDGFLFAKFWKQVVKPIGLTVCSSPILSG